ncbi:MAG: minor capsid protein [Ruminococcus sp.]
MKISQPPNKSINTPNGYLNLKWTPNFSKLMGDEFLRAQMFVDKKCIELMKPYTPKNIGVLCNSPVLDTKIGSGEIHQNKPYARYLYYGEIYGPNIPIYENGKVIGFLSPKKKHSTGRPLQYNTSKNPKAGKMWFERMKADKKEVILRGAANILGGKVR